MIKIGDIIVNGPEDHYNWTSRRNKAVMEVIEIGEYSEQIRVKIISGIDYVGNTYWVEPIWFVLQDDGMTNEEREFWAAVTNF